MSNRRIRCSVLCGVVLGISSGALTGCSGAKEYRVEVRNVSGTTIRAQITHEPPLEDPRALESSDLRAGDVGTLGPVRVSGPGRVRLRVTRPAEIGLPPRRVRLSSGRSAFEVDDQTNYGVDGVTIRPIEGTHAER